MNNTVELDVSDAVPVDGAHHVSTWVFAPADPKGRVPLLFCLPGGSYTKAYWHLEVPGHPGYSFAEHLAGLGALVVAVDHLGTGDSSDARAIDLTPDVVAGANAAAFTELLERARRGSLCRTSGRWTWVRPWAWATRWARCSRSSSNRCTGASTRSRRSGTGRSGRSSASTTARRYRRTSR